MSSLRQMGSGLLYAVVSVVLVVGGLSLALAEGGFNSGRPTSTVQPSPTLLLPSASPTEESTATQAASSTLTPIIATAPSLPSSTPQVIIPTPTTVAPTATRYYPSPPPTSTRTAYHTAVPCGPYHGWVHSYVVQPGDTLYHIATQYQTTVNALQVANCKSTTVIFPGERLWVPNVATITPGVTLIPTFPTSTLAPTSTVVPTEPPTYTPVPPPTDTAVPTDTSVPNP